MSATVETQKPASRAQRAWQWLVDANPVLAKELLVMTRTPAYAGAIACAPLLLTGYVLVIRGIMGDSTWDDGRQVLPVYFAGSAVLLGTLGAILGAPVIVEDRQGGAIEALRFSRVSPRSIVLAKFAAILLAQLAVVAGTIPLVGYLIATAHVAFVEVSLMTLVALAFGAMTAAVGIGVSSVSPNLRIALVLSLLGAGLLGIGLCGWYGSVWWVERCASTVRRCSSVDDGAFGLYESEILALFVVVPVCALATVVRGGLAAGVSGLLDASEDRSLPIKSWALSAFATVALAAYAQAGSQSIGRRVDTAGVSLFFIAAASTAMLFAFAGEPLSPSRRQRARPPRSAVRALFPPARVPSIVFTLVISGIALLGIPLLVRAPGVSSAGLWVLFYLSALGGFMGIIATTSNVRRARWMGAVATPLFLLGFLHDHRHGSTALDWICPLWTRVGLSANADGTWAGSLLLWAIIATTMLFLMVAAAHVARSKGEPSTIAA